jgi:hypothetical protein
MFDYYMKKIRVVQMGIRPMVVFSRKKALRATLSNQMLGGE